MNIDAGMQATVLLPRQLAQAERRDDAIARHRLAERQRVARRLDHDIFVHEPSLGAVGYMVRNPVPDPSLSKPSVIRRWRAYMADVLETQGDHPVREPLDRVFHMAADRA